MAARDILKNFAAFVDGRGYAGEVQSYNPPAITLTTEAMRNGGMDAPIDLDMGMEGLTTSFVLSKYDYEVLALFGVAEGSDVPFTVRGAIESYDGTVKAVVQHMRGKIIGFDRGEWKPGQMAPLTINMSLHYYKETLDGRVTHEIDVINMIRIVGGKDRLAAQRAAMGL
ncbi:phage major tail tube protein [Fuscibacter oryzae]|uniref:Phage major tail tube protein n=1 Tax=Fuscibacter oryzae TaxID=2803939 RepID=A0A8J7MUL0_9RHOB|nr:phage major tail tube protein [Fuscibacter oryzae]MBL4929320.1 phage major tail tube protein [Fuscibacter oryzae]